MNKIVKNTLILTLITVIAGVLLGAVYEVTKTPIAQSQETAKKEAKAAVEKEFDVKEELRHRFGGHFFEKIYATQ